MTHFFKRLFSRPKTDDLRAGAEKKKKEAEARQEIPAWVRPFNGVWNVLPPREDYPPLPPFEKLTFTVDGTAYRVEKDGETVSAGELKEVPGGMAGGSEGPVWLFKSIWTTDIYGMDLAASYQTEDRGGFVSMRREIPDRKAFFDLVLSEEPEAVDLMLTDGENRIVRSLSVRDLLSSMAVLRSGHESAYLMREGGSAEAFRNEVRKIFRGSRLYELPYRTDMPGGGPEKNCLRLVLTAESGLTLPFHFRDEIPAEALQAAEKTEALFTQYAGARQDAGNGAVLGRWTADRPMCPDYVFEADGTYRTEGESPGSGHYSVSGGYVRSDDLRPNWSRYGLENRFTGMGMFEDFRIRPEGLRTHIPVMDAQSIEVLYTRKEG